MSTDRQPVKASHRLLFIVLIVVGLLWLAACVAITIGDPESAQFTFPGGAMAGFMVYASGRALIGRS